MVLLVTTPTILSALEAVPSASREALNLPNSPVLDSPISHEQLIALARWYTRAELRQKPKQNGKAKGKEEGDEQDKKSLNSEEQGTFNPTATYTLNSLLRGTKVYVPPAPPKPEPVFYALVQKTI